MVEKIERTNPILKTGAVPTIFPGLPKYLTKTTKKRPAPKLRLHNSSKKEKIETDLPNDVLVDTPVLDSNIFNTINSNNIIPNSEYLLDFNIKILHEQAATVILPRSMWGIHACPKKTIFAHLNNNLECDKTISFSTTCKPEVLILKKNIDFLEVKSIMDLQNLIQIVDSLIICDGVNGCGKRSDNCVGYVNEDILLPTNQNLNSKRKIRCEPCTKITRQIQKKKNNKKVTKVKTTVRKLKVKRNQNRRLIRKVSTENFF